MGLLNDLIGLETIGNEFIFKADKFISDYKEKEGCIYGKQTKGFYKKKADCFAFDTLRKQNNI